MSLYVHVVALNTASEVKAGHYQLACVNVPMSHVYFAAL